MSRSHLLSGQLHDPNGWYLLRRKPGLPDLYWIEDRTWSTVYADRAELSRPTALKLAPRLACSITAGEEISVRPSDDPCDFHPAYTLKTGSWDDAQLKPEFALRG